MSKQVKPIFHPQFTITFASGDQGGLFLKKPAPLDPPAKTFY
jgi:hypothetical protein